MLRKPHRSAATGAAATEVWAEQTVLQPGPGLPRRPRNRPRLDPRLPIQAGTTRSAGGGSMPELLPPPGSVGLHEKPKDRIEAPLQGSLKAGAAVNPRRPILARAPAARSRPTPKPTSRDERDPGAALRSGPAPNVSRPTHPPIRQGNPHPADQSPTNKSRYATSTRSSSRISSASISRAASSSPAASVSDGSSTTSSSTKSPRPSTRSRWTRVRPTQ